MGWQGHSSFTYRGLGGPAPPQPRVPCSPAPALSHGPPDPEILAAGRSTPSRWAWHQSLHCWCSTDLLPPALHPHYKQVLVASQLPRPGPWVVAPCVATIGSPRQHWWLCLQQHPGGDLPIPVNRAFGCMSTAVSDQNLAY